MLEGVGKASLLANLLHGSLKQKFCLGDLVLLLVGKIRQPIRKISVQAHAADRLSDGLALLHHRPVVTEIALYRLETILFGEQSLSTIGRSAFGD
jgi:hypothetical protein